MSDKLEELALQVSSLIPLQGLFHSFSSASSYTYVACILVCLYLVWLVCFYDSLNRGQFRTLSDIQEFLRKYSSVLNYRGDLIRRGWEVNTDFLKVGVGEEGEGG